MKWAVSRIGRNLYMLNIWYKKTGRTLCVSMRLCKFHVQVKRLRNKLYALYSFCIVTGKTAIQTL